MLTHYLLIQATVFFLQKYYRNIDFSHQIHETSDALIQSILGNYLILLLSKPPHTLVVWQCF